MADSDTDTNEVLETIGANVTRLRKRAGLTQAALAEAVGCETSYMQKIEYGTAMPTLKTLVQVARSLAVPVAALFRATKARPVGRGRPRVRKRP